MCCSLVRFTKRALAKCVVQVGYCASFLQKLVFVQGTDDHSAKGVKHEETHAAKKENNAANEATVDDTAGHEDKETDYDTSRNPFN